MNKEGYIVIYAFQAGSREISESIIKQIHYLVLADKKDDRGVQRRIPVRIMGAKHEPVCECKIGQLFGDVGKIKELLCFCILYGMSSINVVGISKRAKNGLKS